jgi:hypothetical protein
MTPDSWKTELSELHHKGVVAWRAGRRTPASMWQGPDLEFLESIGCSAQELFDFVEDFCLDGEPDLQTVLNVQEICRDYFLNARGGVRAQHRARMEELPQKSDAIDGIAWLPRLIAKARLKLKGQMPVDLMYGCAGDRPFLRRMKSSLAAFLCLVRDHGEDTRAIVDQFKKTAGF